MAGGGALAGDGRCVSVTIHLPKSSSGGGHYCTTGPLAGCYTIMALIGGAYGWPSVSSRNASSEYTLPRSTIIT